MVNGATSRIVYIGVLILLGTCIVGIMVLSALDRTVPNDIEIVLTTLLGFIVGAHFKPPTAETQQADKITARVDALESR
jgi:hypothetical protein